MFSKLKQEVRGDFSICVLILVPKVSVLPSLVAISLLKMKI